VIGGPGGCYCVQCTSRNPVRYSSPGSMTLSPSPLRNAVVGAVIGSKQMKSLPGGAEIWECGGSLPFTAARGWRREPAATSLAARESGPVKAP
jgi:hypothetical protein